MAINDVFNSLTYGGVNSLDYGIYITGAGVFNAPERAVELVEIPGRNGSLDLDEGYWRNIEVTYPAGTFATSQEEFSEKLGAFRNAILAQKGYQRLTDTYNPDEYRLGLYASGLSVEAVAYNQAGEFELVFNCKPQRYLLSGETELTIESGAIINNPTLHEASPLIWTSLANGVLSFNGYAISYNPSEKLGFYTALENGAIELGTSGGASAEYINTWLALSGDEISCQRVLFRVTPSGTIDSGLSYETSGSRFSPSIQNFNGTFLIGFSRARWTVGTAEIKEITINYTIEGAAQELTARLEYDAGARVLRFSATSSFPLLDARAQWERVLCDSNLLGAESLTIDTETGEAYTIVDGQVVDLNAQIALGSDLPKLAPGENKITFNGEHRGLKITPRWWRL